MFHFLYQKKTWYSTLAVIILASFLLSRRPQSTKDLYANVTVSTTDIPLNGFSIAKHVQSFGYPVQVHSNIPTEDDYLITLHRIPYGKHGTTKNGLNPVAFVTHGMTTAAECFVIMGPGTSLGFFLADQGYDVWLANARGTINSKKHKYLDADTDAAQYWDFSWHEIGYYDLPANIFYILNVTGQSRLTYIGHSQGGTTFYVMASTRPEMNRFIKVAIVLAPPVILGFGNLPLLSQGVASLFFQSLELGRQLLGINEIGPQLRKVLCHFPVFTDQICDVLVLATVAVLIDRPQFNFTHWKTAIKIVPESFSARQVLHFLQIFVMADFRRYDFGTDRNLQKYGTEVPPSYDLTKATPPTVFVSALGDFYVTPFNVDRLAQIVPSTVGNYKVPLDCFNHLDFVTSKGVVKLVFEPVLVFMNQFV